MILKKEKSTTLFNNISKCMFLWDFSRYYLRHYLCTNTSRNCFFFIFIFDINQNQSWLQVFCYFSNALKCWKYVSWRENVTGRENFGISTVIFVNLLLIQWHDRNNLALLAQKMWNKSWWRHKGFVSLCFAGLNKHKWTILFLKNIKQVIISLPCNEIKIVDML